MRFFNKKKHIFYIYKSRRCFWGGKREFNKSDFLCVCVSFPYNYKNKMTTKPSKVDKILVFEGHFFTS